jgi:hypothetical protein
MMLRSRQQLASYKLGYCYRLNGKDVQIALNRRNAWHSRVRQGSDFSAWVRINPPNLDVYSGKLTLSTNEVVFCNRITHPLHDLPK